MRRLTFYLALIMMWSALAVSTQAQAPGTFTAIGSTRSSGAIRTATLLHSGKVLLTVYDRVTPNAAEIFDASTGEFTPVGSGSFGSHAVLLPTGKVLLLSSSAAVLYSELYNPENGKFGEYTQLTNEEYSFGGRIRHVHLMPNGNVLMVQISSEHPNIWEIWEISVDPASGRTIATRKTNFFVTGIFENGPTIVPLADGRVLIAMCCDASRIYDPTTNILDLAGSNVPDGRVDGTAGTLIHSGKVLLSGGVAEWEGPATVAANLYDPASGAFTTSTGTRSLTDARSHHSSTLLPDGQVLLAGGSAFNGSDDKTTADLYNPGTGEFTRTGSLVVPRHLPLATLLADGRVLIAGGYTPVSDHQYWQPTNTVEIYTPSRLIPAPALSSLSGDGKGQGTILRAGTGRPANPANPTRAGEALEIFLTGLLEDSLIPPQVSIGGRMAEVIYFGRAPGLAGTNQINVRVPAGVAPGAAVPVRLMYLGRPSNEVTIAVQ